MEFGGDIILSPLFLGLFNAFFSFFEANKLQINKLRALPFSNQKFRFSATIQI